MAAADADRLGFAVVAGTRAAEARLGRRLEELEYDSFWSNDRTGSSGLATLARSALGTRSIELGLGVTALDHRTPASIVDEVTALSLPRERLTIGVGSGGSRLLAPVRRGVEDLRRLLPGVSVAIGALGPGMCRLAGELADTVLLNWALPERILLSRAWVAEGAASAGRPMPLVASYVRVAIGEGARDRLAREQERYLGRAIQYRAALGDQEGPVGIAAPDGRRIAESLAPYRAVLDETIVRGLPPDDSVDAWLAIAEAAVGDG